MEEGKIMQDKKIVFPILAIYIWIFLELFCVIPETIKSFSETIGTIIPYISISLNLKSLIMLVIVVSIFIYAAWYKKGHMSFDKMAFFLMLRCLLGFIQIPLLVISKYEANVGNYLLPFVECLFYFAIIQFNNEYFQKNMIVIVKIISLVVSIQVYFQAIFCVLPVISYSNVYYKACMIIPVGSSNLLSVLIIPGLVATFLQVRRRVYDNLFLIIATGAIVLTKSRFCLAILVIVFIYWVFRVNTRSRNSVFIKFVAIVLAIIVVVLVTYSSLEELTAVALGYSDYVTSGGILNKLSSGRIGGFTYYFERISNHLLIGNGPNYIDSRAHNIVIDMLYQTGLIGVVIFASALMELYRRANRECKKFDFFKVVVTIMLIHSMGEISFFTSEIADIIFLGSLAVFRNRVMFDEKMAG